MAIPTCADLEQSIQVVSNHDCPVLLVKAVISLCRQLTHPWLIPSALPWRLGCGLWLFCADWWEARGTLFRPWLMISDAP